MMDESVMQSVNIRSCETEMCRGSKVEEERKKRGVEQNKEAREREREKTYVRQLTTHNKLPTCNTMNSQQISDKRDKQRETWRETVHMEDQTI